MAFDSPFRIRDTFDVRKINALDVSDGGSSIEELSQAEENRMRHSFNAIRKPEPEYHPYLDLQGGADNDDSSRYIDPADRIPIGDNDSDNEETDVKEIGESTRPKRAVNFAGTADNMRTTLEGAFQPVSIETRNSTPDSVVSSGRISIRNTQGFGSEIRPNTFGRTMRDRIHALSSSVRQSLRPTDPIGIAPFKEEEPDDQGGTCLWKAVIFLIIVTALVAGILTLVITERGKNDGNNLAEKLGNTYPDHIQYRECLDVTFELGEPIILNCTFDLSHYYRRNMSRASYVIITPPFQHSSVINLPVTLPSDPVIKTLSFEINVTSTCKTEGQYILTFRDSIGKDLNTTTLKVALKSSTPVTSLSQFQFQGNKKLNNTWFRLKCEISRDCNNYNAFFVGRNSSGEFSINAEKKCTVSYTDTSGYTIQCNATYHETKIRPFNSLYCKMESEQKNHRREFMFPGCSNECEPDDDRPYNCSIKSPFREALDTCEYAYYQHCFHENRRFFSEIVCPDGNVSLCEKYSATHCRLSWCKVQRRSYIRVYREQVPGIELCGNNFREIIPTTPFVTPTTTTNPPNPAENEEENDG